MNIPYALHSEFTDACKGAITAQQKALNAGQIIQVLLEAGGYSGKIKVTVKPSDLMEFETDWEHSDATRFPARIKAAATALRDCGYVGGFNISHTDGVLSICVA